jgi:farnesyl-diphosphate farnesyltransferase
MLSLLGPVTTPSLDRVLGAVSRSIFLTLKMAPRVVRRQLGTAYLFCRAADTIADTRLLPVAERLEHLQRFRAAFAEIAPAPGVLKGTCERIASRLAGSSAVAEEKELLGRLDACFALFLEFSAADQGLLRRLVTTLSRGMEMDLERFPPEESGEVRALEADEDLDLYCYHVAGCVGEFWTDLQLLHLPALAAWEPARMREKGVRFGKGLQLTNVLRDVDRDLSIGRCYLPRRRLEGLSSSAAALRSAPDRRAVKPLIRDLLYITLEHYRAGWEYTLAIPRRLPRLRLACAWPLLIGLRTLELLAAAEDPCAPGTVFKVRRPEVRALIGASALRVLSNRALGRLYRDLERPVETALS